MSAKPNQKSELPTANSISQQLARQLEATVECKFRLLTEIITIRKDINRCTDQLTKKSQREQILLVL